jgi:hypothetical protein
MNKVNFPSVSNAADWSQTLQITDDTTEQGFDLTAYTTIQIRVTDKNNGEKLAGSLSGGQIVVSDDDDDIASVITWTFRASTMANIAPGSYTVALRISNGTDTTQIILGRLPVVDGGFTS